MAIIDIRPATEYDAVALAKMLRQADVDEIHAAAAIDPEAALLRSLRSSTSAWSGLADGELVTMFGVSAASILGGQGEPWLMGSDAIRRYQVQFLRRNCEYLNEMRVLFPRLENFVDVRNAVSIRWLKWLGFTIHDAAPHGPFGMPFHRFTMGET